MPKNMHLQSVHKTQGSQPACGIASRNLTLLPAGEFRRIKDGRCPSCVAMLNRIPRPRYLPPEDRIPATASRPAPAAAMAQPPMKPPTVGKPATPPANDPGKPAEPVKPAEHPTEPRKHRKHLEQPVSTPEWMARGEAPPWTRAPKAPAPETAPASPPAPSTPKPHHPTTQAPKPATASTVAKSEPSLTVPAPSPDAAAGPAALKGAELRIKTLEDALQAVLAQAKRSDCSKSVRLTYATWEAERALEGKPPLWKFS